MVLQHHAIRVLKLSQNGEVSTQGRKNTPNRLLTRASSFARFLVVNWPTRDVLDEYAGVAVSAAIKAAFKLRVSLE
jgi:hypothetical protein